jgi:hypothetical protein
MSEKPLYRTVIFAIWSIGRAIRPFHAYVPVKLTCRELAS